VSHFIVISLGSLAFDTVFFWKLDVQRLVSKSRCRNIIFRRSGNDDFFTDAIIIKNIFDMSRRRKDRNNWLLFFNDYSLFFLL
jgi:hypothetical protein